MYKHILLPTDGSKLSREAAEAGVRLAKALGARVTAFFAAPPATPIVFKGLLPAGYATPQEHETNIRKAAETYLGAIQKAANAAGVPCETLTQTSDYPAEAIIAAAKKRRCDLIFMASHGRRGLRRESHLGTETQKVLSQAGIAVLVYRDARRQNS
jgi:nucleotide-binding universal stress UspA family protein